jgi:uncharacterized membrane protein YkvA (DUF1232 family)
MAFRQRAAAWQAAWQGSRQTTWQTSWRDFWHDAKPDFAALSRRMPLDEAQLRKFWRKLLREATYVPFAEDALTAHYCAFDRNTPLYVKAALVGAVIYFIVPDDLIPDSIPVLGVADDAAVLAGAMKLFSSHFKPEHREAARRMLERLRAEG